MDLVIRPAEPSDADAIAIAHTVAWQVAYRGVVPDDVLDSPASLEARRAGWARSLARPRGQRADPDDRTYVPEVDGQVVGFGHVGLHRPDEGAERVVGLGELYGFYVHPDWWGTGVAEPLIEACHEELDRRFDSAMLWVLRENPRARRFYEREGWRCGADGDIVETSWEGPIMPGMPDLPEPLVEVRYDRRT